MGARDWRRIAEGRRRLPGELERVVPEELYTLLALPVLKAGCVFRVEPATGKSHILDVEQIPAEAEAVDRNALVEFAEGVGWPDKEVIDWLRFGIYDHSRYTSKSALSQRPEPGRKGNAGLGETK